MRPEPGAEPFAEHRGHEGADRAAQIGHGQSLIHGKAFQLMEDGAVGRVEFVGAESLARGDHVHRQRPGEQGTDLHR